MKAFGRLFKSAESLYGSIRDNVKLDMARHDTFKSSMFLVRSKTKSKPSEASSIQKKGVAERARSDS